MYFLRLIAMTGQKGIASPRRALVGLTFDMRGTPRRGGIWARMK